MTRTCAVLDHSAPPTDAEYCTIGYLLGRLDVLQHRWTIGAGSHCEKCEPAYFASAWEEKGDGRVRNWQDEGDIREDFRDGRFGEAGTAMTFIVAVRWGFAALRNLWIQLLTFLYQRLGFSAALMRMLRSTM